MLTVVDEFCRAVSIPCVDAGGIGVCIFCGSVGEEGWWCFNESFEFFFVDVYFNIFVGG